MDTRERYFKKLRLDRAAYVNVSSTETNLKTIMKFCENTEHDKWSFQFRREIKHKRFFSVEIVVWKAFLTFTPYSYVSVPRR